MLETLNKIKEGIVDVLVPKKCLGCGREGQYICKDCELFLSELPPVAKIPMKEAEPFSVWEYEGIIEKAIWKIKYDGCYDIINELVDKAFEKIELNLPPDTYITYVPMWPKKERQRGFNQAELIARKLGNVLGLAEHKAEHKPYEVVQLLEKTRDNRSQVGLGPKEREENVKGVFVHLPEVNGVHLREVRNVLLVDDVYTTGATARECVKVLRKAGVKNVWVFTLARRLSL